MSVSPSRRRLLQAALLTPVAACTTKPTRPARVNPDDALRQAAIAREQALVARYRAASSPALAAAVAGILADHEQHLVALGAASPSAAVSAAPPAAPPPVTAGSPAQLAAAERAAATAHATDALAASRGLAALLASLSASEASHVVVLG